MQERAIRCIVFDFANTLCSEFYFTPLGTEFQTLVKQAIFTGDNCQRWASPWCCGTLSSADIACYLSGLTDYTPESILTALEEGCATLRMNPAIWRFAQAQRSRGRHSVLATINMDIFTRIVAPAHGLNRIFDVVVNSSDYGTEDKNILCEIAFRNLGDCSFDNSLLIDDNTQVIDAFRSRGGMTYQYTTDEAFAEWEQKTWKNCL
jgi:phosphoserine phosphatase